MTTTREINATESTDIFQFSISNLSPLHAWPRAIKRALLLLVVVAVAAAYVLLLGAL